MYIYNNGSSTNLMIHGLTQTICNMSPVEKDIIIHISKFIYDVIFIITSRCMLGNDASQTCFYTWYIFLLQIMMVSVKIWEYMAHALHFQNAGRENAKN